MLRVRFVATGRSAETLQCLPHNIIGVNATMGDSDRTIASSEHWVNQDSTCVRPSLTWVTSPRKWIITSRLKFSAKLVRIFQQGGQGWVWLGTCWWPHHFEGDRLKRLKKKLDTSLLTEQRFTVILVHCYFMPPLGSLPLR